MASCILAIETSTDICSIALIREGVVFEKTEPTPRGHTKYLLSMIDSLLGEHHLTGYDLTAIAFGCGPGSFTGLRVAAGTVQGLALGWDLPVIPVSTLKALAYRAAQEDIDNDTYIVPILDARMSEVYWGVYHWLDEKILLVNEEQVCPPEDVLIQKHLPEVSKKTIFVGSGQLYCDRLCLPEQAQWLEHKQLHPQAKEVAQLAAQLYSKNTQEILDASLAIPTYLRNKVAWKKSC